MRVRITLFLFFCGLLCGGGLKQTEAAEPVGWWKLNETTGSIAYDSSGNGFNGTVNLGSGSAIWQPSGGFDSNGCANFTAKQYVRIPNGVWDLIGDQMSIAFWVNQDPNHPPGSNWPGPWGCARTPGLTWPDYNWLQLRAHLPRPDGAIDIGKDEESVYSAPGDANAYAGSWNHYVFIKDVNAHTLTLYHNGLKVDQRTGQMEPMPDVNNFMLGGVIYPYPDWYGKIDDLRIYNCALSQLDILKLLRTNPARAWDGFPDNCAEDVPVNITLNWSPGDYAAEANGHDIYFGTDFAEVNEAGPVFLNGDIDADEQVGIGDLSILTDWWLETPPVDLSPSPNLGGEPIVNLTDLAILAGQWGKLAFIKADAQRRIIRRRLLDDNTTYYWRVDEVNQTSIWKGEVWQFNTKGISRVFNDGPGNIRYLIGNDDLVEMQTLFWVPMKGWSPNASSESWNATNVTFSGAGRFTAVDRKNVC